MAENKKSSPMKLEPISTGLAALSLISGGVKLFQGISQRKKAKEDFEKYEDNLEKNIEAYKAMDFRLQNPYEDIDVSTKGQELAQQQYSQSLANTLEGLKAAGGGAGAASLATAISRQAAGVTQKAQAVTEERELAAQQLAKQTQLQLDQIQQQQELNRASTLTRMNLMRTYGAQSGLVEANEMITGGIGDAISGLTEFGLENPDLFKKKKTNDQIGENTDVTGGTTNVTGGTTDVAGNNTTGLNPVIEVGQIESFFLDEDGNPIIEE